MSMYAIFHMSMYAIYANILWNILKVSHTSENKVAKLEVKQSKWKKLICFAINLDGDFQIILMKGKVCTKNCNFFLAFELQAEAKINVDSSVKLHKFFRYWMTFCE